MSVTQMMPDELCPEVQYLGLGIRPCPRAIKLVILALLPSVEVKINALCEKTKITSAATAACCLSKEKSGGHGTVSEVRELTFLKRLSNLHTNLPTRLRAHYNVNVGR